MIIPLMRASIRASELRRGGGWGLALPAELNGVPGPAHLLDARDEIGLDRAQVARIRDRGEAPRLDRFERDD